MTTPNHLGRQVGRIGDDMGVVLCQMDNGAVTKMLLGITVRREPISHWYSLYGTKGHCENARGLNEDELRVYLEADTSAPSGVRYVPAVASEPAWAASARGHGGADALMIDAFIRAVVDGGPSPIDVYAGLDMTLPGILGFRSAVEGSAPLEVPDLRDESVRVRYEDDHWAPGPGENGRPSIVSSAHGRVDIDPSVFEEQLTQYLSETQDS